MTWIIGRALRPWQNRSMRLRTRQHLITALVTMLPCSEPDDREGLVSVSEEVSLLELTDLMLERRVRRVLVRSGQNSLGVISCAEVIRGLRQVLADRPLVC